MNGSIRHRRFNKKIKRKGEEKHGKKERRKIENGSL